MELSLAMGSADNNGDTLKAGAMGTNAQPVLQMSDTWGRGHTYTKQIPGRAN